MSSHHGLPGAPTALQDSERCGGCGAHRGASRVHGPSTGVSVDAGAEGSDVGVVGLPALDQELPTPPWNQARSVTGSASMTPASLDACAALDVRWLGWLPETSTLARAVKGAAWAAPASAWEDLGTFSPRKGAAHYRAQIPPGTLATYPSGAWWSIRMRSAGDANGRCSGRARGKRRPYGPRLPHGRARSSPGSPMPRRRMPYRLHGSRTAPDPAAVQAERPRRRAVVFVTDDPVRSAHDLGPPTTGNPTRNRGFGGRRSRDPATPAISSVPSGWRGWGSGCSSPSRSCARCANWIGQPAGTRRRGRSRMGARWQPRRMRSFSRNSGRCGCAAGGAGPSVHGHVAVTVTHGAAERSAGTRM